MKVLVLMTMAVLSCCFSWETHAYEEGGHLYTVNILTHAVRPALSEPDAKLVTFCAQLPDESSDLDAYTLYWNLMAPPSPSWIEWGLFNHAGSEDARNMVTVQQFLHALTGGDAGETQRVSTEIVKRLAQQALPQDAGDRADTLCALGFGLHLYGDSHAHEYMGENGQPPSHDDCPHGPCMYPTGHGHSRDIHYPDYPLCADFAGQQRDNSMICMPISRPDARFAIWSQYWVDAAKLLTPQGDGGAIDAALQGEVTSAALRLEPPPGENPDWDAKERSLQNNLAEFNSDANDIEAFFTKIITQHGNKEQPCSQVMEAAQQSSGPLYGIAAPRSCAGIWRIYYSVAKVEFDRDLPARDSSYILAKYAQNAVK